MYGREGDTFILAAVGDAILTRKLRTTHVERFTAVIDRLRDADVGFANLETLFHDYEGYPAAETGGTPLRAPPSVADELPWAGIDLVAMANNHTMDYSFGGLEATSRALEMRDIPYAGVGKNLAAARAPTYVDTPAGRVALVAACSTFPAGAAAGAQRPDLQGRPGLSPIHVEATYTVPEEAFAAIEEVSEGLGLEDEKAQRAQLGIATPDEEDDELSLLDVTGGHFTFRPGDGYEVRLEPDEADVDAVIDQIRGAAHQADWVLASLHGHQGPGGRRHEHAPPAFFETFARRSVDAGADAVIGHGPHILRGIELYDGAPIFYSLGDFILQNEIVERFPASIYGRYELGADALPADVVDTRFFSEAGETDGFQHDRSYWESVLPTCHFEDGELDLVELVPLDLGVDAPRPQRGRPLRATGATATRILGDLQSYSATYGTTIDIENDHGVITPG